MRFLPYKLSSTPNGPAGGLTTFRPKKGESIGLGQLQLLLNSIWLFLTRFSARGTRPILSSADSFLTAPGYRVLLANEFLSRKKCKIAIPCYFFTTFLMHSHLFFLHRAHMTFIAAGVLAGPMWILYHLQEYKKRPE